MKQQLAFLLILLMVLIDIQTLSLMWLYLIPLGGACLLLWSDRRKTLENFN